MQPPPDPSATLSSALPLYSFFPSLSSYYCLNYTMVNAWLAKKLKKQRVTTQRDQNHSKGITPLAQRHKRTSTRNPKNPSPPILSLKMDSPPVKPQRRKHNDGEQPEALFRTLPMKRPKKKASNNLSSMP